MQASEEGGIVKKRNRHFLPEGAGALRLVWHLLRPGSALLVLSALLHPAAAWAGCDLRQMEIPVRIVDQRPIATMTLNGTELPLLVDSGAFFSMLSESTAAQLRLALESLPAGLRIMGYTGRVDAKMTRVAKVG